MFLRDKDLLNKAVELEKELAVIKVQYEVAIKTNIELGEKIDALDRKYQDDYDNKIAIFIRTRELEEKRKIFEIESSVQQEYIKKENDLRHEMDRKHNSILEENFKKLANNLEDLHVKGNFQSNAIKDFAVELAKRGKDGVLIDHKKPKKD